MRPGLSGRLSMRLRPMHQVKDIMRSMKHYVALTLFLTGCADALHDAPSVAAPSDMAMQAAPSAPPERVNADETVGTRIR